MSQPPDVDLVAGRYRLEDRVGVGAMGEVWRARDVTLQRDVALKRVRLDSHVDAATRARFQREAVAMAGLSHPNVVSVYDAGTDEAGDGRTAYLVMELLDGPSCADLIASGRSLSLGEVERIGAGVARGLAAAHATGVVHRDIKPGNVVVSRGVPTIVDFGIARLEQEATTTLTAPQTTIGTAAYMSPEQAMGRPVGPASDVYSLGALLIALASGSPPFGSSNALALMRAHIDDPPPSLGNLRDDAPPRLVALLDRMLAKDPARRPTAAEVARVLEGGELSPEPEETQAVAAGAVPTRVTSATERYTVPPASPAPETDGRGGRGLWWVVAAALLAVAGVFAWQLLSPDDTTEPTPTATQTVTTGASPTTSVVTSTVTVTPTLEPTTEPATPTDAPPETPDGQAALDEAVASVGAAIAAVADEDARAELDQLWQPASNGLQSPNAAAQLDEIVTAADRLLDEGSLTESEHTSVVDGVEGVIALL
ncbi:protein kinase [Nostocoides sp. F2B08]|uniref:serine/threonine-protein kinase n=1 Tax=Nostocoides sp. F2B08 TaxID=2653936 RepID=UPI001263D991|nr:serine/threonine-protein kinase [Tetrasphaera sp. F2B08]KAB7744056.1 protein kinase [Tetrasphaera sp. F2B08]